MATWRRALDRYEALLDELEGRLAAEDWNGLAAAPGPGAVTAPATADELRRADELAARGRVLEERLRSVLATAAAEVAATDRRRRAGALYRQPTKNSST